MNTLAILAYFAVERACSAVLKRDAPSRVYQGTRARQVGHRPGASPEDGNFTGFPHGGCLYARSWSRGYGIWSDSVTTPL